MTLFRRIKSNTESLSLTQPMVSKLSGQFWLLQMVLCIFVCAFSFAVSPDAEPIMDIELQGLWSHEHNARKVTTVPADEDMGVLDTSGCIPQCTLPPADAPTLHLNVLGGERKQIHIGNKCPRIGDGSTFTLDANPMMPAKIYWP